jgi:HD-GYP domain-containing protein (c-di-GMP phosphodiesterase class II)
MSCSPASAKTIPAAVRRVRVPSKVRRPQGLRRSHWESIQALVAAVEAKDLFTQLHSRTVCEYADAIARRLGLTGQAVESLRTAAVLHDIGKIGIPDAILQKPGPLTADEFALVQQHPQMAIDILRPASFLAGELPAILHHHERFDGAGYPRRLAAREIPLAARILAAADALDAMLSPRSYKQPYDRAHARAEFLRCRGSQFDPDVANATVEWLDEIGIRRTPVPTRDV